MTCGFVSRGKLAETESVIPAVPVMRIARRPTVAILPLAKQMATLRERGRFLVGIIHGLFMEEAERRDVARSVSEGRCFIDLCIKVL